MAVETRRERVLSRAGDAEDFVDGPGRGCSSAIPARVGESRGVCGAGCVALKVGGEVYFGGDLEAGVALSGEVAGRIEAVRPVAEIIEQTVREFFATVEGLTKHYDRGAAG